MKGRDYRATKQYKICERKCIQWKKAQHSPAQMQREAFSWNRCKLMKVGVWAGRTVRNQWELKIVESTSSSIISTWALLCAHIKDWWKKSKKHPCGAKLGKRKAAVQQGQETPLRSSSSYTDEQNLHSGNEWHLETAVCSRALLKTHCNPGAISGLTNKQTKLFPWIMHWAHNYSLGKVSSTEEAVTSKPGTLFRVSTETS